MNDTTKPASLWRSIVAVLAGLLTNVITAVVTDTVLAATGVYPRMGERWSDGLFVFALSYRVPVEVAGGYVTAKLSPRKPMTHVLVLVPRRCGFDRFTRRPWCDTLAADTRGRASRVPGRR